jgi:hypothetical protein
MCLEICADMFPGGAHASNRSPCPWVANHRFHVTAFVARREPVRTNAAAAISLRQGRPRIEEGLYRRRHEVAGCWPPGRIVAPASLSPASLPWAAECGSAAARRAAARAWARRTSPPPRLGRRSRGRAVLAQPPYDREGGDCARDGEGGDCARDGESHESRARRCSRRIARPPNCRHYRLSLLDAYLVMMVRGALRRGRHGAHRGHTFITAVQTVRLLVVVGLASGVARWLARANRKTGLPVAPRRCR